MLRGKRCGPRNPSSNRQPRCRSPLAEHRRTPQGRRLRERHPRQSRRSDQWNSKAGICFRVKESSELLVTLIRGSARCGPQGTEAENCERYESMHLNECRGPAPVDAAADGVRRTRAHPVSEQPDAGVLDALSVVRGLFGSPRERGRGSRPASSSGRRSRAREGGTGSSAIRNGLPSAPVRALVGERDAAVVSNVPSTRSFRFGACDDAAPGDGAGVDPLPDSARARHAD